MTLPPLPPLDEQLVEVRAQNLGDALSYRHRIITFRRDITQTIQNTLEFNPDGDPEIKKKVLDFIDTGRDILASLQRVLDQINRLLMTSDSASPSSFALILTSGASILSRCELFNTTELEAMEKYTCFSVFPNRTTITRFRHGPHADDVWFQKDVVITKCDKIIISPGHLVVAPLPEGGFAIAYPQHIYLTRSHGPLGNDLIRTIRVPFIITDMVVSKIGLIYVIANNCLYHINKHDQIGHFQDVIYPISISINADDKLYVLSSDGILIYIAKDPDTTHPRTLKFSTRTYTITKIIAMHDNNLLVVNKVDRRFIPLLADLRYWKTKGNQNHVQCENKFNDAKLSAIAASPRLAIGIDATGSDPKMYLWHLDNGRLRRSNVEVLSVDSDMNEFFIDLGEVKPLLGLHDEIYLVDRGAIYTMKYETPEIPGLEDASTPHVSAFRLSAPLML
jgi:hypothetical protein